MKKNSSDLMVQMKKCRTDPTDEEIKLICHGGTKLTAQLRFEAKEKLGLDTDPIRLANMDEKFHVTPPI